MPKLLRVFLIFIAILLASTVVLAQQDAQRIVINYPEVTEGGEDQLLRLYFTVLNGEGMAVPDAEVESAVVVLDNGTRIELDNPTRPDTPLYIVLVLDASGSMQQAAPAMRQAAVEAINIAPQEALFAIIQFNQQVNLIQGFTADRTLAANMVNTVNSVPNSGTCLYDATYSALELMGNLEPTARRAVIVFTDGRDEITLGRGDKCSTHSYDEVLELATDPNRPIPIHTIGLRGDRNINEQELRNTASATGGLSAIGGQDSLNDLFRQIMDALRSQWLVEAPICIESGTHTATLTVRV
ncbi:MAG: VWA domain-containing protein, partial [Anaerolineae bacterium]|nr:VWA domain-containing protein [Anaerolineae bacterium]